MKVAADLKLGERMTQAEKDVVSQNYHHDDNDDDDDDGGDEDDHDDDGLPAYDDASDDFRW